MHEDDSTKRPSKHPDLFGTPDRKRKVADVCAVLRHLTKTECMRGIPCHEPDEAKRAAMVEGIRKRKERQTAPLDLSDLVSRMTPGRKP